MLEVESITLSEFFEKKLTIPEYQRPYVWGEENIGKLLDQIKTHNDQESKPLFYIGSVVLHKDEKGNLNIIDGQQRITTFAIISLVNNIKYELHYENLISQNTIRKNYKYLKELREQITAINFNNINVTTVTTSSQDEAYNFFETLNTGGVRLSGTQIIKAHHLRSIPNHDVAMYGIDWEKEEKYIDDVVKLLLKARKWNVLNYQNVPSRRATNNDWKKIITEEFSEKTIAKDIDTAFAIWKQNGQILEQTGNKYAIRQPLSNGKNFINYLLSFIQIYKQLFVFDFDNKRTENYKEFTEKIIDVIDGTIDLKALYQLALLCYVSKFGFDRIDSVSFWIFRLVYSIRVSVPNRVMEVKVIEHNREKMFLDRILNIFSDDEILNWLKQYTYSPNSENINGVKGRFVDRVLSTNYSGKNDLSDFDELLIKRFNEQQ